MRKVYTSVDLGSDSIKIMVGEFYNKKLNVLATSCVKSRGIKNLNLCVNEGDFFGFIGPNGAGKSTTIRILLGLISKSSGKAKVFDKDITENKIEILKIL